MISVWIEEEHLSDACVWNVAGGVLDATFFQQAFYCVDVGDSEGDVIDSCPDFLTWRFQISRFDQVNLQAVVEQPRSAKVKAGSLKWLKPQDVSIKTDAFVEVSCDSRNMMDEFDWERFGRPLDGSAARPAGSCRRTSQSDRARTV